MAKQSQKSASKSPNVDIIALIINMVSRFGIAGAFFVLLMINATKQQYQEFIDLFILLKFSKNPTFVPYFVIFYVILISVGTIIYYRNRVKAKDEKINILEEQIRALEETVKKPKAPAKKTA